MSITELPGQLVTLLTSLPIGDYGVLLIIILIYMFLGMFLEGIAMLVLTIPVVLPIIAALSFGFDPALADMKMIWFGVIVVIVLEMGMISPPVGINVFVVKSMRAGCADVTCFPRHLAVLVRDGPDAGAADVVPAHRGLAADDHGRMMEMNEWVADGCSLVSESQPTALNRKSLEGARQS